MPIFQSRRVRRNPASLLVVGNPSRGLRYRRRRLVRTMPHGVSYSAGFRYRFPARSRVRSGLRPFARSNPKRKRRFTAKARRAALRNLRKARRSNPRGGSRMARRSRRRVRHNFLKAPKGRRQYRNWLKKIRRAGRKTVRIGRHRVRISRILGRRRASGKHRRRRNPLLEALGNPRRRRKHRRHRRHNPLSNPHRRHRRRGHRRNPKYGTRGYRVWSRKYGRYLKRVGKKRHRRSGRRAAHRRRVARRYYRKHRSRILGRRRTGAGGLVRRTLPMFAVRSNPHRRRRRRHFRRFHARRNPFLGGNWKQTAKQVAAVGVAYFLGQAAAGLITQGLNKGIGMLPASVSGPVSKVQPHLPVISAVGAMIAGDLLSRPGRPLAKYRTEVLLGTGLVAFVRVVNQYLAPYVPANIKPYVGLGGVQSFWTTPTYVDHAGEYVEVPPGVGLRGLQEAAGEFIEVPPGVGLGQLQEAAGEYVEVPPGVGLGQLQEAAGLSPSYQGHRTAGAPVGHMHTPHTRSAGEAAYESQHAGDQGVFEHEYGIFGG